MKIAIALAITVMLSSIALAALTVGGKPTTL
jgi:hypothetical protein